MGVLRFSFGTMGSGKSTLALQILHNLSNRGLVGLLCTRLDRERGQVSSRLGVTRAAVEVTPSADLRVVAEDVIASQGRLDFLVCDEAQFFTEAQVEQLAAVVDELDADVYAFGLLTDFRGRLFPATARFLELADTRHELQVEARCWCGRPATHNARLVDGEQVYEGDVVVLGDVGGASEVTYELMCRRHWREGRSGG
jgi:thymidine kinase